MSFTHVPQLNTLQAKRKPAHFVVTLLIIEFLDELVFGVEGAAWPLIRADLGLTYVQIGLLLSVPGLLANLIEPILGILGDVWNRRMIILAGGAAFTLAVLGTAFAPSFVVLLISAIVFNPASGAFVSLSQATLMDSDPARPEQLMARWTLAGSLGVVAGPLALGAATLLGFGWRETFIALAVFALTLTCLLVRQRASINNSSTTSSGGFADGLRGALQALRRGNVQRWLILLECSDLMLDVLLGFLALYIVDVSGASPAQAALAVAVWTGVGLLGDALLIPLLERVRGLVYLRFSAAVLLLLFPAFLLVPHFELKLIVLALMGLFNAGWYAILQGQLYSSMPGQSGTVISVNSLAGVVGKLIPMGLGWVAQQFGLWLAMWFLIVGPIALLVGLPRHSPSDERQWTPESEAADGSG
jgi:FSR family fosmidomycin resistance protein-like MFS transporter